MNVRELSALLNRMVLAGHGDSDVLVNVYGDDVDDHMADILGRHNWTVAEVRTDGDPGETWVGLDVHPMEES